MHLTIEFGSRHGRHRPERQVENGHFPRLCSCGAGWGAGALQGNGADSREQSFVKLRPHAVSKSMSATRAVTVTLTAADGPSTVTLASARLNYAIAGWLRGEPQLLEGSIAHLPLLAEGSVVVKSWEVDDAATKTERAYATSETRVRFSFVPPSCRLPEGFAAESLVELLSTAAK